MKRFALMLAGLSSLGLLGAGVQSAKADGVNVRINVPVTSRVYTPGVTYYSAPTYYAQPTYYAPSYYAPTYVAPPVYTPAPSYYYAPTYVPAPVYYYQEPVRVYDRPWFDFGSVLRFDFGHGHDRDGRGGDHGRGDSHGGHR